MSQIRKVIGKRIRAARLESTRSQDELASLLGVGRGTISRWETGTRAVPSAMLPRLATVLQTTVAWLTGEQEQASVGANTRGAPVVQGDSIAPGRIADQAHLHPLERDTIAQIVATLVAQPALLSSVLDTIQASLDPVTARSNGETAAAVITQLRGVNINNLTPVSALRVLADLQDLAIHGERTAT
jgi:transcriptional regulator with XRE-family HTH domain